MGLDGRGRVDTNVRNGWPPGTIHSLADVSLHSVHLAAKTSARVFRFKGLL
jgi:hypothetical protein